MKRLHVEVHSPLLLTGATFVPYIWTPFISMTQHLVSSTVCIGILCLFSRVLTLYLVNHVPYSFVYPEYLSLAMAKVWAGKADLPCTAELWRRYDKVVKDRGGYGKHFQDLSFEKAKSKFHFHSLSIFFDILLPQLQCDFSKAGSTLMLSNMVGGRCVAFRF